MPTKRSTARKATAKKATAKRTTNMDAGEAALSWIVKLVVSNENNRNELKEALTLINSYRTLADIGRISDLNNMLHVIGLFVRDERELLDVEIRRIAKHIRKLWFLKGNESKELHQMYVDCLGELIEGILDAIQNENDLENTDDQMKRCLFLLAIFSDFNDDPLQHGICRYDKLFVSKVMHRLMRQTQQMGKQNDVERAENYYRLVYLMDKMIRNWLDAFKETSAQQYDMELLFEVRNHLILLSEACKDQYKLVSLALSTIVGNIVQIEALQTILGEEQALREEEA